MDLFPAIGLVVGLLGALVGVAGWLTGGVRKSVAEARDRDIATLERRVEHLEAEVARLTAENHAKDEAIKVLLDQARGSDELHRLVQLLVDRTPLFQRQQERLDTILRELTNVVSWANATASRAEKEHGEMLDLLRRRS